LAEQDISQLQSGLNVPGQNELISNAADMLSQLTQFAGVVLTPKRARTTLKHIEFLTLSEKKILVIMVTEDGNVQNRIIATEKSIHKCKRILIR